VSNYAEGSGRLENTPAFVTSSSMASVRCETAASSRAKQVFAGILMMGSVTVLQAAFSERDGRDTCSYIQEN
jgi:hypothetical protein